MVYLILLLSAPLPVVEDDRDGRNIFSHASQHLVEAHAPSAVADVSDTRAKRGSNFGALFKKLPIPSLFLFVFVFSIQLIGSK